MFYLVLGDAQMVLNEFFEELGKLPLNYEPYVSVPEGVIRVWFNNRTMNPISAVAAARSGEGGTYPLDTEIDWDYSAKVIGLENPKPICDAIEGRSCLSDIRKRLLKALNLKERQR